MPVQIDRMDTSVEIMPQPAAGGGAPDRRTSAGDRQSQEAMREMMGSLMAEELDRFLRNRGSSM
jgi:hypothetical protein